MKRLLATLCFELPALTGGEVAPSTLTLVPPPGADGLIRGVDGRAWKLSNPAAVVTAFNRARAITENHAGMLAAKNGGASPAFAWIEAIRVDENGGITADVKWTARGLAALNGRDYRFLSPEFLFDEKTSEIAAIVGAAVTNDPNFPQLALNAEHDLPEQQPMSLLAILAALGLPTTADETACVTAINSLKSDKQTALNAAQAPDPTRFVPRAELEVALNRATTAEGKIADVAKIQREAEVQRLVSDAEKAGKVVPATRDHYLAICRAEGGIEQFTKLVAVMPVLGADQRNLDKKPPASDGVLSETDLAICSQHGLTREQFIAARGA